MTFKFLALVVEQFWHVYWISYWRYCKTYLACEGEIFDNVLLQIHSGNCLQKVGILDLSFIKLLQN